MKELAVFLTATRMTSFKVMNTVKSLLVYTFASHILYNSVELAYIWLCSI